MTSIYSVTRHIILTTTAILGLFSVILVVGGAVARVTPLIVVSGSMEPTIPTGSLLFAAEKPASDVRIGDIVTLDRADGRGSVTHRVIATTETKGGAFTLELRGDANRLADFEPYVAETVMTYVGHVPHLGNVALFLQTTQGLLLAAAAGLSLIALLLLEPRRREATMACPAELARAPLALSGQ
jgi:signal peptidase